MKYKSERVIAKPRAEVFRAFTELENAAQCIEGIKKMELLTEGPMKVGTRFRETRVMFGKEATEEMTVTEFVPDRGYTTGAESCGARYRAAYVFEDAGDATRVRFEFESEPVTFIAKLMTPVMKLFFGKMMTNCFEKDLDDLSAHIERGDNSTDTGGAQPAS